MSEIAAKCPHCGASLTAQKEWVGMKMECPSCGKEFVLEQEKQGKQEERRKQDKTSQCGEEVKPSLDFPFKSIHTVINITVVVFHPQVFCVHSFIPKRTSMFFIA